MSTFVITDLRPVRRASSTRSPQSATSSRSPQAAGSQRVPGQAGHLRLTRRGRVVVFLLGLALVLAFSVMIGSGSVATSERGVPAPTEIIMVGQGDTLWAIASDIAAETGQDDVRDVMAQIEDLNSLKSAMLIAGQELRIPLVD